MKTFFSIKISEIDYPFSIVSIAKANGEEMAVPTKKQVLGAKKHTTKPDGADADKKSTGGKLRNHFSSNLNTFFAFSLGAIQKVYH